MKFLVLIIVPNRLIKKSVGDVDCNILINIALFW